MRYPGLRIFLAVSLLFLQANALQAGDFNPDKLQGLGDTRYQLFESETLGHPLHLYVRVPENTDEGPFPVIYLLDGGTNFPLLSAYYHYLRLGEEIPQMVIVGISYGSDRFEGGNYRSSDFTAPSDEREWWGKAPVFQQVLADELMPLLEKSYPADSSRRILFGQSLGGQFVLYNALTRPELFWGHIASNPALHRNLPFFLQWRGQGPAPVNASRLFLAEAELDAERFKTPAEQWIQHWSRADHRIPFVLEVQYLPGQTHLSAAPEAFRLGVSWLFSEKEDGK